MSSKSSFDTSLARVIDHTLLKPDATLSEIERLCGEARTYGFASVCVNPSYVELCAQLLGGTGIKVCTVIGFPLGATSSAVKAYEAAKAITDGAQELDMVINIGKLKSGDHAYVLNDIQSVVTVAKQHGATTKVIIETALLTNDEKVRACSIAKQAGADFVKTSTGFAGSGATKEDIQLMRETVGATMGVKASGGIRTRSQALLLLQAGATRIGASSSVQIVTEQNESTAAGY